MVKIFDVAELGEITVVLPKDSPGLPRFRARIVERSGVEISLELGSSECRELWEALGALKEQYPQAFGIQ